jgi:hypothetical protein
MTLRCGIIGAGQVAWRYDGGRWDGRSSLTHAACFDRHADTKLVAVFDPDTNSLDAFNAGYADPQSVTTYHTLEDFMALDLDLIAIASPTQYHSEHLRTCLEAGVGRVWIEKPVTLDFSEFEDLRHAVDAMQTAPRICVNYFRRALPQVAQLKAHLRTGAGVTGVEIIYSRKLAVNGVHMLDLLGHLFDVNTPPPLDWLRKDVGGANPNFGLTIAGVPITVTGHDMPYHLIELRVTGIHGRMALTQGGAALTWEASCPNPDYPGFFSTTPPQEVIPLAQSRIAMKDGMYLMLDNLIDAQASPLSPLSSAHFAQGVLAQVTSANDLV